MKHIILAGAIVFLIAFLRMFYISGFSNNTIYLFIFTASFFVYRIFFERMIKIRWVNAAIIAGVFILLAFCVFLAAYGMADNVTYEEDALLVLGCGIKGEEVSQTLSNRLDKAVEYHLKNPDALIIVSGGQGPNEDITEARAMAEYLTAKGVPAGRIIEEGRSLSTYENIYYSNKIIRERFGGDAEVALTTSGFHIYRGEWFAKNAGLNVAHTHSKLEWYAVPVNYVRECAAVIKMWLIKK